MSSIKKISLSSCAVLASTLALNCAVSANTSLTTLSVAGPVTGPTAPPGPPVVPVTPTPTTPVVPVSPGGPALVTPTPTPINLPPVVVPTDVEPSLPSFPGNYPQASNLPNPALKGLKLISSAKFPDREKLKGSTAGLLVRHTVNTKFKKLDDFVVQLMDGEILVSVKRPTKMAIIETIFGDVSVASSGDVIVRSFDDTLRVMNLDGTRERIKVQLDQGPFTEKHPTIALAPGYELIASKNKLRRSDMRPRDGIARRHFQMLEKGNLAVSEFSVESAIKSCDVVAILRQSASESGIKARRVLGDMSKMAAVLNFQNGTQGFTTEQF